MSEPKYYTVIYEKITFTNELRIPSSEIYAISPRMAIEAVKDKFYQDMSMYDPDARFNIVAIEDIHGERLCEF